MNRGELVDFLNSLGRRDFFADDERVDVLLSYLHRWTSPWAETLDDEVSGVSQVVDALHPGKGPWVAAGVPVKEIGFWELLGANSNVAGNWIRFGLGVSDAAAWSVVTKLDLLDPELVAGWEPLGDISRETAFRLIIRDIPGDPGLEWCEAGWDEVWVEDFDRWFRAFRGVDPGELLINYNRDRALESMRRWVDSGIVGEDLEIFDSKGYTPAEAVKLIGDGVAAKDALVTPDRDERLAEQVSCRSWSTIWKRAQALGWGIKDMTSYHDGQFYVIELRRLVDGREAEVIIEDGRFSRSYTKDGGNLQILKMRELLDTL